MKNEKRKTNLINIIEYHIPRGFIDISIVILIYEGVMMAGIFPARYTIGKMISIKEVLF